MLLLNEDYYHEPSIFETGERSGTTAAYCGFVQNCSSGTENLIWGDGPAYCSNSAGPTAVCSPAAVIGATI